MSDKKIKVEKVGTVPGHARLPSLNDELVEEIKQHLETAPELVGPRGPHGASGEQGRRGRRGLKGEQGTGGMDGDHGVDGRSGYDGVKGKDGAAGVHGRQGQVGAQGPKGDKGDQGEPGEKGKQGRVGPGGGRGAAGAAGKGHTPPFTSISLVGTDLVFARGKEGPLGPDITVDLSSLNNQGGFVGLGPWRSRTETTSPPATGQVRFDNADPELATELFLHETNSNGEDLANFLALLEAGDLVYIQVANDSTRFILCEISSNTDSGDFVTLGLASVSQQGGAIPQNTTVNIIATIAGGGGGGATLPEFQFFADQFENPNNADWTVNALAPASADSNNAGLTVRLFDDTAEEGVGFTIEIPATATNIVFDFVARAETAPGVVNTVGLNLYNRAAPDNAAVEAWSAAEQLTDLDIPTNEFFQEDTQTLTLATLGVTAGETTQFELTRVAPTGGTDLTGDWALMLCKVSFT